MADLVGPRDVVYSLGLIVFGTGCFLIYPPSALLSVGAFLVYMGVWHK